MASSGENEKKNDVEKENTRDESKWRTNKNLQGHSLDLIVTVNAWIVSKSARLNIGYKILI